MLVLSSCLSHHASCGKWSLSAACTQLVGRQDLQIVSTNTELDFSGLYTLTVITDEQSKSSRKYPSRPKPDTFFSSFCSCLFSIEVGLWSYEGLEVVFAWFIFMAQQSGDYPNVKVIYLAVHPLLGFCVVRKRGTDPYCISWPIVSNEYPDKQVGALMWAPRRPDSPNLRLPGPFFNKALMLAERPQCSVSLIVRRDPSGMLMNIQWGFVSRTVPPLSASPSLSSPLKLQGRFTGLLLQGGHLAHCDANSLKFDV